jgi:drug/metabolite transporter (DMT)-like permease
MASAADPPGRQASARPWGALGMLAVLIFAWGGNYTWISIALRDIGPWTFTAVRYVGAAVVVGTALAFHRGPGHVMPMRGERARLAAIGMLQGAGLTILLTLSLQWIESTHTILLMYTNPLWALLLSVLLLGERFSIASIAGIALGLLGMAILTNPLAMPWNAATVPGVVSALAATIAWALGSVLYRRGKWESTFWQQVFWQLAVSGIAIAVPALILEWNHAVRRNWPSTRSTTSSYRRRSPSGAGRRRSPASGLRPRARCCCCRRYSGSRKATSSWGSRSPRPCSQARHASSPGRA